MPQFNTSIQIYQSGEAGGYTYVFNSNDNVLPSFGVLSGAVRPGTILNRLTRDLAYVAIPAVDHFDRDITSYISAYRGRIRIIVGSNDDGRNAVATSFVVARVLGPSEAATQPGIRFVLPRGSRSSDLYIFPNSDEEFHYIRGSLWSDDSSTFSVVNGFALVVDKVPIVRELNLTTWARFVSANTAMEFLQFRRGGTIELPDTKIVVLDVRFDSRIEPGQEAIFDGVRWQILNVIELEQRRFLRMSLGRIL